MNSLKMYYFFTGQKFKMNVSYNEKILICFPMIFPDLLIHFIFHFRTQMNFVKGNAYNLSSVIGIGIFLEKDWLQSFDLRVPHLLHTVSFVRFLSGLE